MISLDFLPTFTSLAGGRVKADWKLDGLDLNPLLRDKAMALPERTFFWRKGGPQGSIAMRKGNYKLFYADRKQAPQLFDLAADVGEATDIAKQNKARVASMTKLLAAWEAQQVAPLWTTSRRRRRR